MFFVQTQRGGAIALLQLLTIVCATADSVIENTKYEQRAVGK